MSDNCGHEEHEHVTFQVVLPVGNSHKLRIRATHARAVLDLQWEDDGEKGTQEMTDLIATMPHILRAARQEVEVEKDLRTMNAEINNILDQEQPGE